jgi:hypothetical protein
MRKTTLFTLLLLSSLIAGSQTIFIHESREKIGNNTNNSLVVGIYGVDAKDVEKEWKSKMKDLGAKVSNDKGDLFGDNAVIKEMGNNTVDMHSRIDDKKTEVDLVVAFDLGGAYLSSGANSDKYRVAEKLLHDFALKLTKDAFDVKIKGQQKALEKLNGQEKDLDKENKNLNLEIIEYQNKIKKDQAAVEKNANDQNAKQKEINQQQQLIDQTTKDANSVK